MDALPLFSQFKSTVQFVCGQRDQAKQTQVNFSRQCPGVSQVRSLYEVVNGDQKDAWETQKQCGSFCLNLANGVPLLGHIKGGIHYSLGDPVGGDAALKAASHTSSVMAGAAAGLLLGGPVGAVALGIGSGAAMDATITAVDSKLSGKPQPYGFLEPLADPKNAGKWCDAVAGVVFDGVAARVTGKMVQRIQTKGASRAALAAAMEDDVIVRNVRPFSVSNWQKVFMMVKEGSIYLLKGERLQKIRDIYSQIVSTNVRTQEFNSGEFVIRFSGDVIEVFEGKILLFFIRNNRVFVKDISGNDIELQEHHLYTKNPGGEVEEIQDTRKQASINKVIREQDESSDVFSVSDAESVYHDGQDYILDLEEDERFASAEELPQDDLEEEHQGLLHSSSHRGTLRDIS